MTEKTATWVIWYNNGQSISDLDYQPWEIPRTYKQFVECIVIPDDGSGRTVLDQTDTYCWHFDENAWVPHNLMGLWQYLSLPGCSIVLQGFQMTREAFFAVRTRAMKREDPRLPTAFAKPRQLGDLERE